MIHVIGRHLSDADDSCILYSNYMLHPLLEKEAIQSLRNAAVILHGPCRVQLVSLISLSSIHVPSFQLVPIVTPTVYVVFEGSELERFGLIRSDVVSKYYSVVAS